MMNEIEEEWQMLVFAIYFLLGSLFFVNFVPTGNPP